LRRTWNDGDVVTLKLSATVRTRRWEENSLSIYRGPLLYALALKEDWSSDGKNMREVRTSDAWNFALFEDMAKKPNERIQAAQHETVSAYPWTRDAAPITLTIEAVEHPTWNEYRGSAGPIPWSPQPLPLDEIARKRATLTLIPYGCTTLRISAFPTIRPRAKNAE
ncbi:MAG TPA: hypothetical protein VHV77_04800, partial [Pirellulales bacterium]|nr:hypothetical protein [Pirellulales bacterium]